MQYYMKFQIMENRDYIKIYLESFYLKFQEKNNLKQAIKNLLKDVLNVDFILFSKKPLGNKILLIGWDWGDFSRIDINLSIKEEKDYVLFSIVEDQFSKFIFDETVKFLFTVFKRQPLGIKTLGIKKGEKNWIDMKFILLNLEEDGIKRGFKKIGGDSK